MSARRISVVICFVLCGLQPVAAQPLLSTTYLGGCGSEDVRAMIVNELSGHRFEGAVYVAGRTTSSSFDAPCDEVEGDIFVARLDRELATVENVRILRNPSGNDAPIALAMIPAGHATSGWIVMLGETDGASEFPGNKRFGTGGRDDAVIAALDPELMLLVGGPLGGTIHDRPRALAIDPIAGDIYVGGETNSADFPGTAGGAQSVHAGVFDAFVSRFRLSISLEPPVLPRLTLEQSTFLGGRTGSEVEVSLAVPGGESIYLQGRTNADDLPVTNDAPQSMHGGGIEDLFVARLSSDLRQRQTVTYLGGNGIEESRVPHPVVHSATGAVYIAGITRSEGTEPDTKITWQRGGFIVQFSPLLDAIGSVAMVPVSEVSDVLQHPSGDLYLLGRVFTDSFPAELSEGAAQETYGGGTYDTFVARYDAALDPVRATYFGGSDTESLVYFAVDPMSEEIYVAGNSRSLDLPFTAAAGQPRNAGLQDGFVARFGADLSRAGIVQATYFGGSRDELLRALVLPELDSLYVAGTSTSEDLDTTDASAQANLSGDSDGFLARFSLDLHQPLPSCVGDCNGDSAVRVNELILGVNIALQRRPLADCADFDVNDDGAVSISELIRAVSGSLRGCTS